MITQVVSGGQTGADRGGLDAAIELGVPHGGWCPKGFKAEDGRVPHKYRLQEHRSEDYRMRTTDNVQMADATVIFVCQIMGRGSSYTRRCAEEIGKPTLVTDVGDGIGRQDPNFAEEAAKRIVAWLKRKNVSVLNVAGTRESRAPSIQKYVKKIMLLVLEELREGQSHEGDDH